MTALRDDTATEVCDPCEEQTVCAGFCDRRICNTLGPAVGATCSVHTVCEDCVDDGWATECGACRYDIDVRAREAAADAMHVLAREARWEDAS